MLQPKIEEQKLYLAYYRLFVAKLNCYCYASDIDCLFQGFFYDLYRMTDRHMMQKSQQKIFLTSLRQEDIFKRFITLLKEKHSYEHFCSFYAKQLCVTPKYLTTVVKKVSGKNNGLQLTGPGAVGYDVARKGGTYDGEKREKKFIFD